MATATTLQDIIEESAAWQDAKEKPAPAAPERAACAETTMAPAALQQLAAELDAMKKHPEISAEERATHEASVAALGRKKVLKPVGDRSAKEAAVATLVSGMQLAPPIIDSTDELFKDSPAYLMKYLLRDMSKTDVWRHWVGRTIESGRLKHAKVVYVGAPLMMLAPEELTIAHISWVQLDPNNKSPLFADTGVCPFGLYPITYPNGLVECVYAMSDPERAETAVFIELSSRKSELLFMRIDNDLVISHKNRIDVWGGARIPVIPDRFWVKKTNGIKNTHVHKQELAQVAAAAPADASAAELAAEIRARRIRKAIKSITAKERQHRLELATANDPARSRASAAQMFPSVFCAQTGTAMASAQLFARFAQKFKLDASLHSGKFLPVISPEDSRTKPGDRLDTIAALCFTASADVFPAVAAAMVDDENVELEVAKTGSAAEQLALARRNDEIKASNLKAREENMAISVQAGVMDIAALRASHAALRGSLYDPDHNGVVTTMLSLKAGKTDISQAIGCALLDSVARRVLSCNEPALAREIAVNMVSERKRRSGAALLAYPYPLEAVPIDDLLTTIELSLPEPPTIGDTDVILLPGVKKEEVVARPADNSSSPRKVVKADVEKKATPAARLQKKSPTTNTMSQKPASTPARPGMFDDDDEVVDYTAAKHAPAPAALPKRQTAIKAKHAVADDEDDDDDDEDDDDYEPTPAAGPGESDDDSDSDEDADEEAAHAKAAGAKRRAEPAASAPAKKAKPAADDGDASEAAHTSHFSKALMGGDRVQKPNGAAPHRADSPAKEPRDAPLDTAALKKAEAALKLSKDKLARAKSSLKDAQAEMASATMQLKRLTTFSEECTADAADATAAVAEWTQKVAALKAAAEAAATKGPQAASATGKPARSGGAANGGGGSARDRDIINPITRFNEEFKTSITVPEENVKWMTQQLLLHCEKIKTEYGNDDDVLLKKLWRICRPEKSITTQLPADGSCNNILLPSPSISIDKNEQLDLFNKPMSYLLHYNQAFIDFDAKLPRNANIIKLLRDTMNKTMETRYNKNSLEKFGPDMLKTPSGAAKFAQLSTVLIYLKLKHKELVATQRKLETEAGRSKKEDHESTEDKPAKPVTEENRWDSD